MFNLSSLLGLATIGLHVLVPLLGLILVVARVHGTARRLGVAGCAILVGIGILQGIWIFAAPALIRSIGGPVAYGAVSALLSVVSAVGLALVIGAVVTGRSGTPPQTSARPPYPQQPYSQHPFQQGPAR